MDKLRSAEFKEAFDEFDTVVNINDDGCVQIEFVGREWHHLPGGAAGSDESHGTEPH